MYKHTSYGKYISPIMRDYILTLTENTGIFLLKGELDKTLCIGYKAHKIFTSKYPNLFTMSADNKLCHVRQTSTLHGAFN